MGELVQRKNTLNLFELFRNDAFTKRFILTDEDGAAYSLSGIDHAYFSAKNKLSDPDASKIFIIEGTIVSPATGGLIDIDFTQVHTAAALDAWAELSLVVTSPYWERTIEQWHLKIWSDVRRGT